MSCADFTLVDAETERVLFALVKHERLARDIGDWDALAAAYWPEAVVRVTWFTGSAAEFIKVSRERRHSGGRNGFHAIDPVRCEVAGDRALVESRGQILLSPVIDGVLTDVTSWCRFFSRAVCREGVWRLLSFDGIYAKDRVDPVEPRQTVTLDYDLLASCRDSYQFLSYLNRRSGYPVPDDLPGDDRPDLTEAFYAEARQWLHGDACIG